jgi:hypothetical protein
VLLTIAVAAGLLAGLGFAVILAIALGKYSTDGKR